MTLKPKISIDSLGVIITLVIFILLVFCIQINAFNFKNRSSAYSLDLYTSIFPFSGDPVKQKRLLFVDIDEESLSKLGQWPWPRFILADIMQKIKDGKPSVVGIDVLLTEIDRFSPQMLTKIMKYPIQDIESNFTDGDQVLANSLIDMPVVLATALNKSGKNSFKNSSNIFVKNNVGINLKKTSGVLSPIDKFTNLMGYGFVNIDSENVDGVVRYLPMLAVYNANIIPSFLLEMIRISEESSEIFISESNNFISHTNLNTGFISLPILANGNFILHHSQSKKVNVISAQSILENKFDLKLFENKIIVIGSSSVGLNDLKTTSLENSVPGGVILLNAVNQILNERYLISSKEIDFILILTLCAALLCLFLFNGSRKHWFAPIYILFSSGFFLAVCLYFFHNYGLVVNLIYLLIYLLAFLAWQITSSVSTALRKQELNRAFGQYLSPEMVKAIELSGHRPELGGHQRIVTVMFVDVRGFSTISEKLMDKPQVLSAGINIILGAVSDCIHINLGTIDKFIGDCVMAMWNAPLYQSNHADLALHTAFKIEELVPTINKRLVEQIGAEWPGGNISLGIGIATGNVVVGNFGSPSRLSYSVLGDTVNLAARIESLVKKTGITTTVSEATANLTASNSLIELDSIYVRGRTSKEKVFVLHSLGNTERLTHSQITNSLAMDDNEELRKVLKTIKTGTYPQNLFDYYKNKVRD
ncbi:MAG: adenylate/guanylate cyclase domain-containing protein [Paracoccaceae bacterium]|nr:adenylate/guanylate cyclase domain-containing protein [Paracoccaceae bacterium]